VLYIKKIIKNEKKNEKNNTIFQSVLIRDQVSGERSTAVLVFSKRKVRKEVRER